MPSAKYKKQFYARRSYILLFVLLFLTGPFIVVNHYLNENYLSAGVLIIAILCLGSILAWSLKVPVVQIEKTQMRFWRSPFFVHDVDLSNVKGVSIKDGYQMIIIDISGKFLEIPYFLLARSSRQKLEETIKEMVDKRFCS